MSDICLFCDVQANDRSRIVAENEFGYVIRDGFPVTSLHTLIIPKRHVFDYFGLHTSEVVGLNQLLLVQRESLLTEDPTIDGFNIGMNCGETAGQSVWHCHMHLIPRRKGDVKKPRGGVRHLIGGCPRFCVNGLMAGNCRSSQRKRNDRKQRTDRPPFGGLQKT